MIKIEKLTKGASATFVRDNMVMPVFTNQLLSETELNTLVVISGTVTYSIDEQLIVERTADTVAEPIVPAEPKSQQIELALESPIVATEEAVETVIVKPVPKAKPVAKAKK